MKRLLSIALTFAMLLGTLSLVPFAVSAETYSGTWGNLSWVLDENGTLTISGDGEMDAFVLWDYGVEPDAWHNYSHKIETVVIKSGVTSISDFAFGFCAHLTSVTIGESVASISKHAFFACDSLTNIQVDSSNAVYSDIDGVLFNKEITVIVKYPIGKPDSLYAVPNSVASIGDCAFYSLYASSNLTNVTIPDSVTFIGEFAFAFCSSLESITISGSITSIGQGAFMSCSSLESITIFGSVASIGCNVFSWCENLETVYYGGSEEQWNDIRIDDGNDELLNANMIYNYIPTKSEMGDVNGDEYIDNTDAIMILKYDAGIIDLPDAELLAADVNGDGWADNTDAIMILKYDAGIIDQF